MSFICNHCRLFIHALCITLIKVIASTELRISTCLSTHKKPVKNIVITLSLSVVEVNLTQSTMDQNTNRIDEMEMESFHYKYMAMWLPLYFIYRM